VIETLARKMEICRKDGSEIAVFYIRFDNYYDIVNPKNDKICSDIFRILKDLFEMLKAMQPLKIPAMYSNNENLFIFSDISEAEAARMMPEIKKMIKTKFFEHDMEFSYGYCSYPNKLSPVEDSKGLVEELLKSIVSYKDEMMKKRILVIEDEPSVRKATEVILQKFGLKNIKCFADGKEAMSYLADNTCDLILLDMEMPHMSGYEVIGRLKENRQTENIPVIIVSAYDVKKKEFSEYISQKAIPVVRKPYDQKELYRWVRYML
jgi:CheY-like chemotaxis protein/GGDEF domain-containing protein